MEKNGLLDVKKENKLFTEIWDVFSSELDREDAQLAVMTKSKCKSAIKREFHLY